MDEDHDSDEAETLIDPVAEPARHAAQIGNAEVVASALAQAAPGRTLLPTPVANAVSLATRSTTFALRLSTSIGGYGLSAAKFTTLSSLELGRGILEGILHRAGKDVISGSRSDLGRADAETVLERSLETLHQTMNRIMFWTTTGFHVTGTAVSTVSQVSQLFLSVLDQFFGSTDSSRAIASIITLIRREFQNPATGVEGEKVGVIDLILGLCGLAYLQSWCQKMMQEESRTLGYEEIVWDIVVPNDGEPVGAHEESLYGVHKGSYPHAENSGGNGNAVGGFGTRDAMQRYNRDSEELPERQIREYVTNALPKEATVSIQTSTTITKLITVEVQGTPSMPLVAPPGLDLVESEISHLDTSDLEDETAPTYKIVYRLSRNEVRNSATDGDDDRRRSSVEAIEDREVGSPPTERTEQGNDNQPPTPPPKDHRSSSGSSSAFKESTLPSERRGTKRQGSTSMSSPTPRPSVVSPQDRILRRDPENAANQKKVRRPLDDARPSYQNPTSSSQAASKVSGKPPRVAVNSPPKSDEKKSGFRSALKKGSGPISNFLHRDPSSDNLGANYKPKTPAKTPRSSNKPTPTKTAVTKARSTYADRDAHHAALGDAPRQPQRGNPNYFSSRDLGVHNNGQGPAKDRSSYIELTDRRRRNSVVSLTDTFSIHSYESRAPSPAFYRAEPNTHGSTSHPRAGSLHVDHDNHTAGHTRTRSNHLYSPSIYTLKTVDSQSSLVLPSFRAKSAYSDSEALDTLRRTGTVSGLFPDFHLLRNITRYSRYASAAYGWNFLKFMGIRKEMPTLGALDEATHRDVRSFAHHTGLPAGSILLSSFVDPQGGSDSTGSTETGVPLVHTIAVDAESRAVVLACRGTLGFEDVLADMTCDYDDLTWRGRPYRVHKGIHASARRLLYGGDGRVLATLREALDEFPNYGLVLCGHSLGGAVTALLGVMLAEPASHGTAFVTTSEHHQHGRKLLTSSSDIAAASSEGLRGNQSQICLPAGRPIHVYAYGPPSTMSPALQRATRGLVTSTVHGNDLVPHLSLGVLHDFQALALAFKSDNSAAKAEVRRRLWDGLQSGITDRWRNGPRTKGKGKGRETGNKEDDDRDAEDEDEEDEDVLWAWAALKTLRASMMSDKLLPPGEVFTVECTPALRRDAFTDTRINMSSETSNSSKENEEDRDQKHIHARSHVGGSRPATRVVLRYVRDVEVRFREVRFGASMLADHSPARYEDALRKLWAGVVTP